MTDQILRRQTTFWEIGIRSAVLRVHFLQKQEHHFVDSPCSDFRIVPDHPVLLDYHHPWSDIFVSSPAAEPEVVVDHIVAEIASLVAPWRDARGYFNERADGPSILYSGHGLLLRSPDPIADAGCRVLTDAGVPYSRLAGRPARGPMKAFVSGNNFVVARDFRIEEVKSTSVQ